jgi:S1-C subfamily serine protease
MFTLRHAVTTGSLGIALIGPATTATAQTGDALYVCAVAGATRTIDIGATICDAAPTDALTERLEPDNLQLRAGALVTGDAAGGIAQVAGLQAGDVIYRVGGVDVEDNIETTARLSLIGDTADTVVNFLRRGRPYRVKLRRP